MEVGWSSCCRRAMFALVVVALAAPIVAESATTAGASYNYWNALTLPFASTSSHYSTLDDVGCASAAYCVAVGSYATYASSKAVLDVYRDGAWKVTDAQEPEGATSVALTTVGCAPGGDCTVGGSYQTATGTFGLVEELEGTSASITTIPDPSGAGTVAEHRQDVRVQSLTCPSTGNCVAVGAYGDPTGDLHPLIASLSSGSWTAFSAPVPANFAPSQSYNTLFDVQCLSTTSCITGGWYEGTTTATHTPTLHGLVDVLSGSSWTTEGTAPYNSALHAACASTTQCFAPAGSTIYADHSGTWSSVAVPVPAGAPAGATHLTQIACPATDRCVAMGSFIPSGNGGGYTPGYPLVATWNGTSWSDILATPPANAVPTSGSGSWADIYGLSCGDSTSCAGVGWYRDDIGDDYFHPLIVRWTGGTVTTLEGPEPAATPVDTPRVIPFGQLANIACVGAATCVATGSWWLGSGPRHAILDVAASSPAPVITTVMPDTGAVTGGTPVTITGSHLTGATSVSFGSAPALSFTVTSSTSISTTAPAHGAGKVAVSVVTTHGLASKPTAFTYTAPAPPITTGYDLVGSDGGVFVFPIGQSGGFFGSLPGLTVQVNDVVGIVPTNNYTGYDLVGSDGGVFVFPVGQPSGFFGSLPGLGVSVNDIVGIVPTNDFHGYDLVGRDGGVFVFPLGQTDGFFGSLPGDNIHVDNIVGIAVTGDDRGYWMAGSTGHVYNLGDATAVSSPAVSAPIVGIAADATSRGGWLVADNGSVYPFGDATSLGTLPAQGTGAADVVSIVPTPSGDGYWIIGANGQVFAFGDATPQGTLPSLGVGANDVVGAVPTTG